MSPTLPPAELNFVGFRQLGHHYAIEFDSDEDIESMLKKNYIKRPIVYPRLTCALEDDVDFRVEHNIERTFGGDFPAAETIGEKKYRYVSTGNFYQSLRQGSSTRTLPTEEVVDLLANRQEIQCKVSVTVYLAKPYYSKVMKIPAADLVGVLKKVPPRAVCCKR